MVDIAEQSVDLITFFSLPEVIDMPIAAKINQRFILNLGGSWKCDYSRNGYIYVINAIGTNRYKIGKTSNLERRLSELNGKQSSHELKIVFKSFCSDNAAFEATLHSLCANFRVHGEWFEFDKSFFCSVFNHPELGGAKLSKHTAFECVDDLIRESFLMLYILCERALARNILSDLINKMQQVMSLYYGQRLHPAISDRIDGKFYLLFRLINFGKNLSEENSLFLSNLAEVLLKRIDSFLSEEISTSSCFRDPTMREVLFNDDDFLSSIVDTSMELQGLWGRMENLKEYEMFRDATSLLWRKAGTLT